MTGQHSKKLRVVIVGGGFGGLYAARALGNQPVEVTLIDRRNFHLFQPLLYQVATGGLSPGDIASPLRSVLKKYQNIQVLLGTVTTLDPNQKRIYVQPPGTPQSEPLPYDRLIIATGATHHYFGNEHWKPYAPGLKTIEDALEIRRRIFLAFEEAEWHFNAHRREQLTTFVIVGGGPTGVELAGALGELARFTLRKDFRNVRPSQSRIILLEAGERILPAFPPDLSRRAQHALEQLGVEVRTGTLVTSIHSEGVRVKTAASEEEIPARTILWAAGVQASATANSIASQTGIPKTRNGKLPVAPDLSLPGYPDIDIIGDLAHCMGPMNQPLPGTAPVAMQQGKYVAQKILNELRDKETPPFKYRSKGNLAVIGRNKAVADFGTLQFSGFPAWLLWVFVHIAYLVEYDNKALVLFQWAVDYVTRKKGARLITGPEYKDSP